MNCPLPTDFAPAERDEIDKVLAIADELLANPLIDIFNSTPIPLIIINTKRQTIFCNTVFQTASIFNTAREILGMRPGKLWAVFMLMYILEGAVQAPSVGIAGRLLQY